MSNETFDETSLSQHTRSKHLSDTSRNSYLSKTFIMQVWEVPVEITQTLAAMQTL